MTQTSKIEQQLGYNSPSQWRFYIGQWVEIKTQRPNVEQYNGAIGQIKVISNNDIIYCVIGRHTPCFHPHEVRPMSAPGGQAA